MAKLINIGFGNVVNSRKIVAVVSPDAAPVKRMIQSIKGTRSLIDATQGRKTKAVIVTSGRLHRSVSTPAGDDRQEICRGI